jgi:endoglucanase
MRKAHLAALLVSLVVAALPALPTNAAPAAGNPVELTDGFYVDPDSNPAEWVRANPDDPNADTIRTQIAERPGARWFGDWSGDITAAVSAYTTAAAEANKLPVLVAYNIPGRDCGGHSGGGAGSPEAYRTWISQFADGIGDRPAVVIIEPDALAQLDCMPADEQPVRVDLLHTAVEQFAAKNPNTWAYMDGGNANWIDAPEMANRLRQVEVGKIRGFALNTSNYYTTEESVAKGDAIQEALGGSSQFVVDTSRNGNGSNGEWCNPAGRKLGVPAQQSDNAELLLWIKVAGDSDGDCGIGAGIPAGTFSPDLAMALING